MDIKKRLEAEHSKTLTQAIVHYVGDDKKRFRELMAVFLKGKYRLTQRAAWPLSYVITGQPHLLKPYFGRFIKKLDDPSAHPAVARNIFRVLQETEIPEKYRGLLVDKAFKELMNESRPAAIRAFAITVAARICKHYPELKNEFMLLLKELDALPQQPSLKSRIKMALKELKTT